MMSASKLNLIIFQSLKVESKTKILPISILLNQTKRNYARLPSEKFTRRTLPKSLNRPSQQETTVNAIKPIEKVPLNTQDSLFSHMTSNSNTFASTNTQSSLGNEVQEYISTHVNLRKDASDSTLKIGDQTQSVLAHSALVIGRQVEMMNVFLGFEQANKYSIKDATGKDVGFIAEESQKFSGAILRQLMRTRRAFHAVVLDPQGQIVLKIHRPVKWFLNSTISIMNAQDQIIGEVKQVWHLWRRKYDLFVQKKQFAQVDGGFLTWDFLMMDENQKELATVNRNFKGFMREIFTDTGQYVIRTDALETASRSLSLDERAVVMAAAITIDIDYFSRHSESGVPIPLYGVMGGGSSVPAEAPTSGAGGGGFVPPIIIPGSSSPSPSESSTSPPPPPSMEQSSQQPNSDSPFLSDEEAGIFSKDETGSSMFEPDSSEGGNSILEGAKKIWEFFNDD